MSGNGKICRHLHIPLQSGDDEILKKMNRPYTTARFGEIVKLARKRMPDLAFTTDIMVGFPGETEANFKNTVSFVKDIMPSRAHIFTFSKREGTAAFNMEGPVSDRDMKRRYHELRVAALGASFLYRSRFLGQELEVLVETKRDKDTGLLSGYSDNYIKILFDGPDTIMNMIQPVKIKYLTLNKTLGEYGQA
jgi:threonylcarbamoyladenosine tRNA methylthiotransferase MtaB